MLLDIEARIGELLPTIEETKRIGGKHSQGQDKGIPPRPAGVSKDRAKATRAIAKHPETVKSLVGARFSLSSNKEMIDMVQYAAYYPFMKHTSDDIRRIRKRLGLTQAAFGKRLGVTQNTVARWERGEMGISETASRLIDNIGGADRVARLEEINRKLRLRLRELTSRRGRE